MIWPWNPATHIFSRVVTIVSVAASYNMEDMTTLAPHQQFFVEKVTREILRMDDVEDLRELAIKLIELSEHQKVVFRKLIRESEERID